MKVSIGISFYNAEKYLAFAIQSVLNQSFTDFELILLDDGSTDRSLQIARSYNDKRITVLSDGQNKGLCARLNELVFTAKGYFYARMDADDIMDVDRIKREIDFLEQHPDIDVVGSKVYTIDTANHITGAIQYPDRPDSIENACRHRCFIHPSVMARRQWFLCHPYKLDANRIEDFELWTRTIENNHFCNLTEPLMFYRTVGLPYLSKYLLSNKNERRVLRKLSISAKHRWNYLFRSYLKCGLYVVFTFLRLQSFLVSLRSQTLSDVEMKTASLRLVQAIRKNK